MGKNIIQFQKGLNLIDFLQNYNNEEKCREELYKLKWPDGFRCPSCDNESYCKLVRHQQFQCNKCNRKTSVISGTIFHSTKLPLTKWFLAIYLMTQSKNGIAQMELKRQLGVSINTAALLYHKIAQTMMERDNTKPLTGDIEADDAYWGGYKKGKRGRGSTNKIPFIAAVEKRDGKPQYIKLTVVPNFRKNAVKEWLLSNICSGSHLRTDGLSCFTEISNHGCIHEQLIVGNSSDQAKTASFNWVNTILGNLKNSLRGTFHKLHPDHLARHLATFTYRFNRRFTLHDMVTRLMFVGLRTPPMPRRLLTADSG
jgi:transposase-like protein